VGFLGVLVLVFFTSKFKSNRNIHDLQLLQEKTECERGVHVMHVAGAAAVSAKRRFVAHLRSLRRGSRQQPAVSAQGDRRRIRVVEKTVAQKFCGAVRDHAVSLHFPKAEPPLARTSLGGLPREHMLRSARAGVVFVGRVMAQSLVIRRTHENERIKGFSREPTVELHAAVAIVAIFFELVAYV
jgi:hypothetical protein